jgi:hypothetical protein
MFNIIRSGVTLDGQVPTIKRIEKIEPNGEFHAKSFGSFSQHSFIFLEQSKQKESHSVLTGLVPNKFWMLLSPARRLM